MSTPLLHVGAVVMCSHGGQATFIPSQSRVMLSGQPALTVADLGTLAGCGLSSSPSGPCVTVQYIAPATRVRINGQPAVLSTSSGLTLHASQAAQGTPTTITSQVRVGGQ